MIQLFKNVNVDWLGQRRIFISISIVLLLVGMGSALYRHAFHPGGTEAFNLGVDFKGGTVVTVSFSQPPSVEEIRSAINRAGLTDAVIQPILDKPGQFMIRLPRQEESTSTQQPNANTQAANTQPANANTQPNANGAQANANVNANPQQAAGVDPARAKVGQALKTFGPEVPSNEPFPAQGNAYRIEGTDAVGEVAGKQLRNQAIAVTLAALVGMLLFIAFRFEWAYGAAAVIAVFHTVLVTLGLFSIFQWEINLTVIAALLTLVGFDVNDSIVVFDRIRENLRLHRNMSLYDVVNMSINQTLSRTVITSGLVFLSVVALVLFGGATLRPFSLALLMGIIFGTYDSIAVASPIMVWMQRRFEPVRTQAGTARAGTQSRAGAPPKGATEAKAKAAARGSQGAARS
jgi:preprotein translocase subunit SecF